MSELAFNLSGERFELPAKASGWRVRRLKPKGAPEVVYGRNGIPLILPIDADIDDLRHEARMEGRYRLDPVDEHGRTIETTSAGYVCVQPSDPVEPSAASGRGPSENPVIEAMRMNTELARTIIDKFPLMLESAAVLLRAADAAGMPARLPRPIEVIEAKKEDEEDDEDIEDFDDDAMEAVSINEPPAKSGGLQGIIETLAPFVMPAIMNAFASGKIKIPGGFGAALGGRKTSPTAPTQAAAAAEHQTNTPGVAPAPGPRDPAPAARDPMPTPPAPRTTVPTSSAPRTAAPRPPAPRTAAPRPPAPQTAVPTPPSPRAVAPTRPVTPTVVAVPRDVATSAAVGRTMPDALMRASRNATTAPAEVEIPALPGAAAADEARATAAAAAHEPVADAPTVMAGELDSGTAAPPGDLPTLDPAAMAHFVAIHGGLSLREAMMARALAAELTPAELRGWITELRQLSVADGVARIRALVGDDASEDTEGSSS